MSAGIILFVCMLLIDIILALSRAAYVNSHPAKLRGMQENGFERAELAVRVSENARRLILSLRSAQTVARLLAIGAALLAFSRPDVDVLATTLLTFGGVLLGSGLLIGLSEFSIENIALRDPEVWAVRLAPVVSVLVSLLAPVGWLMVRLARWITGGTSARSHPLVTEEEIMTLVDAGEEEGVIEEEEKAMIYSIFQLADTLVREVMIPRIDMLAFDSSVTLNEATEDFLRTGYSRAPVYSGSIDNIIGLLYVKDLLEAWQSGEEERSVAHLCREPYFVPEAKKVDDLLTEMQTKRVHMAVVVDEYGGTAGLVTIEDVVEEIVGEIRDEYDHAEELPYQLVQEGEYLFSGRIDLDDVNQIASSNLPKDTSETLGGFIYSHLGKVPIPGEAVDAGGLHLIVEEVSGRRIRKVRAQRIEPPPTEEDNHGQNSAAAK
jgi:putative hemolysin